MHKMVNSFVAALLLAVVLTGPRAIFGFSSANEPCRNRSARSMMGRGRIDRHWILPASKFEDVADSVSRRQLFESAWGVSASTILSTAAGAFCWSSPSPSWAAQRQSLDAVLYRILRVREAVQQEARLIRTGKFKDVQRANVKLAVKFMVNNYRLNDAFVTASAYLESNDRRLEAGQVGQAAVQNLITILEYFDSADVQNIKVGQDGMGGKEQLVLKGLDATRKQIDDFLSYFSKSDVDAVVARIAEENRLNVKEFDPSLGDIVNLAPPS